MNRINKKSTKKRRRIKRKEIHYILSKNEAKKIKRVYCRLIECQKGMKMTHDERFEIYGEVNSKIKTEEGLIKVQEWIINSL